MTEIIRSGWALVDINGKRVTVGSQYSGSSAVVHRISGGIPPSPENPEGVVFTGQGMMAPRGINLQWVKLPAIFTIFCQEVGAQGTIWISSVEANDAIEASKLGRAKCAAEWEYEEDEVHVLGVAAGNVQILEWDDQSN